MNALYQLFFAVHAEGEEKERGKKTWHIQKKIVGENVKKENEDNKSETKNVMNAAKAKSIYFR